jgi:hypothetical protein
MRCPCRDSWLFPCVEGITWTAEALAEETSLFEYGMHTKRPVEIRDVFPVWAMRMPSRIVWPLVTSAATEINIDYKGLHESEVNM